MRKFEISESGLGTVWDSYLLDVGGNIGQFNTFVSLALGKDAYALEPLKKNYDHTCRTLMKNDLHKHKLHL